MDPRAEVYFALSECFKEPTPEFARDVASGLVRDVFSRAFGEMGLAIEADGLGEVGTEEEVLDWLVRAYHALFAVPSRSFVLPVESVFKEWRAGEGLGTGAGMIMGAPALNMLERYGARGLKFPKEMKDYPDHLALLLEYGGLLCQEGDLQGQREFLASHLDHWTEILADQVEEISETPFYRAVVCALRAFLRAERQDLGATESS